MNKNREFLLNRLKDMYGDDFDPIMKAAEMATLLQAEALSCEDQYKIQAVKAAVDGWLKIGEFVTPKLKAVEVDANVTNHEALIDELE